MLCEAFIRRWNGSPFKLDYGLPWASYQIRKIAGCACAGNAGNVFPRRRFQRKSLVNDPGMHHGTCVTHVPWCMSGSFTCGDGENVAGIPGACAPAILRIWQEAHSFSADSPCFGTSVIEVLCHEYHSWLMIKFNTSYIEILICDEWDSIQLFSVDVYWKFTQFYSRKYSWTSVMWQPSWPWVGSRKRLTCPFRFIGGSNSKSLSSNL